MLALKSAWPIYCIATIEARRAELVAMQGVGYAL